MCPAFHDRLCRLARKYDARNMQLRGQFLLILVMFGCGSPPTSAPSTEEGLAAAVSGLGTCRSKERKSSSTAPPRGTRLQFGAFAPDAKRVVSIVEHLWMLCDQRDGECMCR